MIETIRRDHDVILHAADLEHLYTFRDFPVFMGCTDAPRTGDLVSDMSFWISRSSGMIQLNPLLPLDVLYPESHGSGYVGASWAKHHLALAAFIAKFNPASVLEIGGAHGILAANYGKIRKIPWTILEPNPTPGVECEAKIVKGFFDEHFRIDSEIDAVVHSHVFEHIYDPEMFVKHLAGFLKPGKKLLFSVPNMRVMLERKYTNCLNFEHTIYLSDDYVDYLLRRNGFRIVEKEYFLDDHSIFYAAVRDDSTAQAGLATDLYSTNKRLYERYIVYHRDIVAGINAQTARCQRGQVFLFGAHVQSQYLIGFGLDLSNIENILDNDARKHGKRLYGTGKVVAAPAVLADVENPVVIIRAGTFTDEIVSQIRGINPRTQFLPEIH